jgi:hypothetical protein
MQKMSFDEPGQEHLGRVEEEFAQEVYIGSGFQHFAFKTAFFRQFFFSPKRVLIIF